MNYFELFIAFIAGGGAWAGVRHRIRNKKSSVESYASRWLRDELEVTKGKNNLLESYNARHVQEIAILKQQIFTLKMQNEVLQFAPLEIPLPMWAVDKKGYYDYINPLYEEIFLLPFSKTAADCEGKNLYEIWPKAIADQYTTNNNKVLQTGAIFNDIEDIATPLGAVDEWRIIKFKRHFPLGVVGIAIPKNGFFDKYMQKIKLG